MIKIFEGAMGTTLQALGLAANPCPDYASVTHPEEVSSIHKDYITVGANIIETNTFGASPLKLAQFGLVEETEKINLAGVKAARVAAGDKVLVAGNMGPSGRLISPLGDLAFEEAAESYARQIKALVQGGVDYLLFETLIDLQEMRAGIIAAKAVSNLPVICQFSFGENGRTVTGTDSATAAVILEHLGASIVGMNCSVGPEQMVPLVKAMAAATDLPISVQPNAGLPILQKGKTIFPLSPEDMGKWAVELVKAGANIIGGCCGTTPAHIQSLVQATSNLIPVQRQKASQGLVLASRSQCVYMGKGYPTVLIGERINPTGRKAMAAEIKEGNFTTVKKDALSQVEAGAKVLDINMGVPGLEQKKLMKQVVDDLAMLVNVPFSLDSVDPEVIEEGLKAFPGRALINSVRDKKGVKEKIFALAKKYGAAVLILPLEEKGLPKTAQERLTIVQRLVEEGKNYGLGDEDFMLDPLVLTVATEDKGAQETLRTLQLYARKFGYPTTMGLSNISFGLPGRENVNAAFYAMALGVGLNAPIINPLNKKIKDMTAITNMLLGYDPKGGVYSSYYVPTKELELEQDSIASSVVAEELTGLRAIEHAVIHGEKERAAELTKKALIENILATDITDGALIKAMEKIGEDFSESRIFLPQVMLAAEAMKAAFDVVRAGIKAEDITYTGKVVLATVKGDIHDLGKNIVAALLSNSGFQVADLGKDVAPEVIVEAVEREQPDIVGLCALMTTTLDAMADTIELLHRRGLKVDIMVGGAVLTKEYAQEIKADMYAADGIAAVQLAKEAIQ